MKQAKADASGLIIRTARIWSGMLLLAFVSTHLLNLSLGVISIGAMDAAHPFLTGLWSNRVMGILLLSALLVHFFLGLWAIYRRPTLRTNLQDLIQLLSGVIVVPLLATHAIGVTSLKINGIPFDYAAATKFFWLTQPQIGLLQVVLLSVVWIHGCAGLFTWLRSKESMRNVLGWLYPIAVAVPVLALIGFAEAGRGVLIDAQANSAPAAQYSQETPPAAQPVPVTPRAPLKMPYERVKEITNQIIWGSIALAVLAFAAREIRVRVQSSQSVRLQRGQGAVLQTTSNLSVLDSFRDHNEPHAGLCEGRGRCGTCAVRIVSSEFPLPDPTALEIKTLNRIGAGEDARLACQLTPSGGFLEVEALYPADYSFKDKDYVQPEAPTGQTEVQA